MKNADGTALVLGDGVSGRAAMRLLKAKGRSAVQVADGVRDLQDVDDLTGIVEAVVSPGFALDHPWLDHLRELGIPLVSELEFGARHCRCKRLAITGSLGKSTIVMAAVNILQHAGFSAEAVGNIGRPVSDFALASEQPDWMVVEVSSFQLETMSAFQADGAVVLNVVPNHLDRHGDMDTYRALKFRLFEMLPSDAPRAAPGTQSVTYAAGTLRIGEDAIPLDGIFGNDLLGPNAALLASVLLELDIPQSAVFKGFASAQALDHRAEFMGEINGVRWVNDSKSTCLDATLGAVRQTKGDLRLLVGGRPKQRDFSALQSLSSAAPDGRSIVIYPFGEAAPLIAKAVQGSNGKSPHADMKVCQTMEQAVRQAALDARVGETILLSPGCTSFDEFDSFAHRGTVFSRLMQEFQKE